MRGQATILVVRDEDFTALVFKGWIQKKFRGIKYSEPIDQPAMTQAMDLALCRQRSPSFDKLCRELEERLRR